VATQRYLDPSEARFAFANVNVAYTATLDGSVDDTALTAAFEALAVSIPLLRSTIVRDEKGYLLRVSLDKPPALEVADGDYWDLVFGEPDPAAGVARLVRLNGEQNTVVLLLHHAVGDARYGLAVFRQLWELYGQITGGAQPEPVVSEVLPGSIESILLGRWTDNQPAGPDPVLSAPPSLPAPVRTLTHRIRLSEEDTERLLSISDSGTLLHSLVCAALLMSTVKERPSAATCRTPVDLRDRLEPRVQPTEATNFISGTISEVLIDAEADIVTLARRIKQQIVTSIKSDEPHRVIVSPARTIEFLMRPVDAVVTNMGEIAEYPVESIVDVRFFTSRIPAPRTYFVTRYGGKLSIELALAETETTQEELAKLAGEVAKLLTDPALAEHYVPGVGMPATPVYGG
jgi:hypothetical protein